MERTTDLQRDKNVDRPPHTKFALGRLESKDVVQFLKKHLLQIIIITTSSNDTDDVALIKISQFEISVGRNKFDLPTQKYIWASIIRLRCIRDSQNKDAWGGHVHIKRYLAYMGIVARTMLLYFNGEPKDDQTSLLLPLCLTFLWNQNIH